MKLRTHNSIVYYYLYWVIQNGVSYGKHQYFLFIGALGKYGLLLKREKKNYFL